MSVVCCSYDWQWIVCYLCITRCTCAKYISFEWSIQIGHYGEWVLQTEPLVKQSDLELLYLFLFFQEFIYHFFKTD